MTAIVKELENRKMISLIVPVFNEEEVLPKSFERMASVMESLDYDFEIIYIDDGSSDRTWKILQDICLKNANIKALRFSRNFGHQPAVTAGMDIAKGDALVIIDADLQDPPEVIPEMIAKWEQGYEVVYGLRAKREGESAFKKLTASMYYRTLRAMSAFEIPLDTGDFRLIDRKVADALCAMREHNRFLRGMSAWAGFSIAPVEYVRQSRAAGQTHYTLKKMVSLALNGILGFSDKPLRIFGYIGAAVLLCSFIGIAFTAGFAIMGYYMYYFFAFFILTMLFGIVLAGMGVQGMYISRLHDEALGRPIYIVRERAGKDGDRKRAGKDGDL